MRRGDHVLDAVGGGNAAHGLRDIPGFGAVVNFRQDMAVNVDHEGRLEQIQPERPTIEGIGRVKATGRNKASIVAMLCLASTRPHIGGFETVNRVCCEMPKNVRLT